MWCKIELPRRNTKREGEKEEACWGVVWEIDDSTKFTLAVIPEPVISCRDKLTPKHLGSHKLSSMSPNQRLWKWINLLSMTLMIFKWPWHNFLLQNFTGSNTLWIMATSYRNLILQVSVLCSARLSVCGNQPQNRNSALQKLSWEETERNHRLKSRSATEF